MSNVSTFSNVIPGANVTYTLGNITHQWNDLFVSNNTIYVGGVPLGIDATGNLTVNGNVIPTIGYVNTAVANVTVSANAVSGLSFVSNGSYYLAGDVLSSSNASIGGTGSGWNVSVTAVDSEFTPSEYNLWQFDSMFDSQGRSEEHTSELQSH